MQCKIVNCCKQKQQGRRRKLLLIYVTDVMLFADDAPPCVHTLYKSEQTVVLLGNAVKHYRKCHTRQENTKNSNSNVLDFLLGVSCSITTVFHLCCMTHVHLWFLMLIIG